MNGEIVLFAQDSISSSSFMAGGVGGPQQFLYFRLPQFCRRSEQNRQIVSSSSFLGLVNVTPVDCRTASDSFAKKVKRSDPRFSLKLVTL